MNQSRIERIKSFASILNSVAAGCLLGVFVAVPLQSEINDHFATFSAVSFMLILMSTALGLAGLSWLTLGLLDP